MNNTLPIDEELTRLHQPVVIEDNDPSALDGFTVTSSGSIMIPTGSTPSLHRSSGTVSNTLSSSFSSLSTTPSPSYMVPHPSNFASYATSPTFPSDPYPISHQFYLHQLSGQMLSPNHYYMQQQQQQQQMQMAQAFHSAYGHRGPTWHPL